MAAKKAAAPAAVKPKAAKVYKCVVSGVPLAYAGRGRPPLYAPEVRKQVLAQQRKNAREERKAA